MFAHSFRIRNSEVDLKATSVFYLLQHPASWQCQDSTPRVLSSVSGPSLQEGYWVAGACPEKGNKAGEGSREQVLRGAAEEAGAVQSGEEEAEGGPYCSLQLSERRL